MSKATRKARVRETTTKMGRTNKKYKLQVSSCVYPNLIFPVLLCRSPERPKR
mgnify:CR=1 FL=1